MNKNRHIYTKSDLAIWALTYFWLISFVVFATEASGFVVALGTTVLMLILSDFKLNIGPFHKHIGAFYIFCLLSVFWALNYHIVLLRTTTILEIFICMCVFYDYYVRLDNYTILLKIIVYAGYTVVIYSYAFYGLGNMVGMAQEGIRLGNEFANVNSICMFAAMAVIIDVYLSLYGKLRWSLLVFIIPTLVLISFSQSRKALFMVFFAPIMLYLYKNSHNITKDLRPMLRILVGLIFVGFIVSLFSDSNLFIGITRRIESLINGLQGSEDTDTSTYIRMQMIDIGIKTFKESPILGVGIGNSLVVMSRELGYATYFHNNYVELLAGGGVIAVILYYSMHLSLLRQMLRYRKKDSMCVLFFIIICTTLLTDYGAVTYYSKNTYFYFMMYFAFIERCKMKYSPRRIFPSPKRVTRTAASGSAVANNAVANK